ncbi:amidase [Acinetobacter sp. S40]|uniref:amidase n=1 Tax=unclassified Acinetobacter TaxID=196816 RepID=UPI00190DF972|nr:MULTISPECIES: amidase [unclassified Acinetobacter]MBJ9984799.1 amidase [Acinetobacter sp. S40]MBK0062565.1 amidase [Acinetobacter sp. S55]MBK0066369.1 amidase [Acinetobacter sp. S54]
MNIIVQEVQKGTGALKVMVKDSIDIQGIKTMVGSKALMHGQAATANADVVDRILAGDCQIIAKTNLHELAFGITGINQVFGTAINPKYPELIPGGSSSGSAAAVAAGLADFTLGTDTGGSIRMPAACCGVYGLKPTFGRISRQGVHPAGSSLDCVGPFANSVEMIESAMQIIDPTFHMHIELAQAPKLAWLNIAADSVIIDTIQSYLAQASLTASPVAVEGFDVAFEAGMQIINYENWQAYGELTQTGLLGADVNGRLLKAAQTTLAQVKQAEQVKAHFAAEIDALLAQYDALILPTLPQLPPKVIDAENTVAFLNLTGLVRPFNLSGHPAISVPLETEQGLPVGLQIVAKWNADEYLCAIAKYIVKAAQ